MSGEQQSSIISTRPRAALVIALTPPATTYMRDWQGGMEHVLRAILAVLAEHVEGWSPDVTLHIREAAERVLAEAGRDLSASPSQPAPGTDS